MAVQLLILCTCAACRVALRSGGMCRHLPQRPPLHPLLCLQVTPQGLNGTLQVTATACKVQLPANSTC